MTIKKADSRHAVQTMSRVLGVGQMQINYTHLPSGNLVPETKYHAQPPLMFFRGQLFLSGLAAAKATGLPTRE